MLVKIYMSVYEFESSVLHLLCFFPFFVPSTITFFIRFLQSLFNVLYFGHSNICFATKKGLFKI